MKNQNPNREAFAMPAKPIRNSAKALIIRENKVLCTKNRDLFGDFYLLPGGGQNHCETLVNALIRECLEEIGATVKVKDLAFLREYLSANHEFAEMDKDIHQVEFIFNCELLEEVNSRPVVEADSMQTGIEWLPLAELQNFRFYPKTLVKIIQEGNKNSVIYLGDTN